MKEEKHECKGELCLKSDVHVKEHENNINLLLYRIDKLEEEQRKENASIMTVLQAIQEGLTETNKTLIMHTTEIAQIKEKISTLETEKVDLQQFKTEDKNINSRLDTYKQILMAIAGGLGVSLLIEFFKII